MNYSYLSYDTFIDYCSHNKITTDIVLNAIEWHEPILPKHVLSLYHNDMTTSQVQNYFIEIVEWMKSHHMKFIFSTYRKSIFIMTDDDYMMVKLRWL